MKDSAPLQLLNLIWDNASKAGSDSWRRYNGALQEGLSLAIRSGMKFEPDDFKVIEARYRPEYWMGMGSNDGEGYFQLAVINDNISAAASFEKWKGRKPIIWDQIRTHDTNYESPRRLFIGAWFQWQGEWACVTKFLNEDDSFRACSYKQKPNFYYLEGGKVVHRFLITRDEIHKARKTILDQKKAMRADSKKLDNDDYREALLKSAVSEKKAKELEQAGAILAFWWSDKDGKPCNSGTGGPRKVGMIEEEKGPLVPCQKGALHATLDPTRWRGERIWVVAMYPPIRHVDGDKVASLKREILADVTDLPAYNDLMATAEVK